MAEGVTLSSSAGFERCFDPSEPASTTGATPAHFRSGGLAKHAAASSATPDHRQVQVVVGDGRELLEVKPHQPQHRRKPADTSAPPAAHRSPRRSSQSPTATATRHQPRDVHPPPAEAAGRAAVVDGPATNGRPACPGKTPARPRRPAAAAKSAAPRGRAALLEIFVQITHGIASRNHGNAAIATARNVRRSTSQSSSNAMAGVTTAVGFDSMARTYATTPRRKTGHAGRRGRRRGASGPPSGRSSTDRTYAQSADASAVRTTGPSSPRPNRRFRPERGEPRRAPRPRCRPTSGPAPSSRSRSRNANAEVAVCSSTLNV